MNVLDQKKEMCLSFDTPPSNSYLNKYNLLEKVSNGNLPSLSFIRSTFCITINKFSRIS